MKGLPFILAVGTTATSVAFQLALATGQLQSYAWLTRYLWTVAGTLCFVWLALTVANRHSKRSVTPDAAAASYPSISPASLATALPRPPPQLNIRCVEARLMRIHGSGETLAISPPGLGGFEASVVCFRNDPVEGETLEQPNLRAHIIYRDDHGDEIADVPNGVWLGEETPYAKFTAGNKNCLLLVFIHTGTLSKAWIESYTSPYWMIGVSYRIRDEPMLDRISTIDVSLLRANGTCVMQITLEAREDNTDQLPDLSVRGV